MPARVIARIGAHGATRFAERRAQLAALTITAQRPAASVLSALAMAWVAVALFLAPLSARAQGVAASEPVRTLIGDIALILRTDRPGTLRIGVAGATRSLTLSVRATDARRWADSASMLMVPMRRPRARAARPSAAPDTSVRRRAVLEEPGVGAGTFVLLRIDSAATRRYMLFVDDASLDGIRQPLEPDDAKLLIQLVKRSATLPRATAPAKKRGAGKGGSSKPAGAKSSAGTPATIGGTKGQPSTTISSSSPAASLARAPVQGR